MICMGETALTIKEKALKGKTPMNIKEEMKAFEYEIGVTEEEMTEKVREMITYMKTDEFWLEHGGNAPYFVEGGELLRKYECYT